MCLWSVWLSGPISLDGFAPGSEAESLCVYVYVCVYVCLSVCLSFLFLSLSLFLSFLMAQFIGELKTLGSKKIEMS